MYEIQAPLYTDPARLRHHMAQYDIDGRYRAATLMDDGSVQRIDGWSLFTPLFTGLGGGAGYAGFSAGVLGPGGAIAGMVGGMIIDALLADKDGKKDGPREPAPIATVISVQWKNVSPRRAVWAEHVLCKFCQRHDWRITSPLLDERNAMYAQRNPAAPAPWAGRGGWWQTLRRWW